MKLNKLKQQINNLVKASQDEVLLQDVVEMICQNKLSEKEIYNRSRLEESIRQADAGMLTPASEVIKWQGNGLQNKVFPCFFQTGMP